MKFFERYQLLLFVLTVIAGLGMILPRVWALHPLYLDPALRETTRAAVEKAAEREGWLLSDLSIEDATAETVTITYRAHRKGPDPESCHVIRLNDSSLRPCDAEQN